MDKTRRSLIASAVAASTSPTALSVLGVNLFSQASHAANTLETTGTYGSFDSGALYQIPKLVGVINEPGPNGTFYTGWMGKLEPIDFLQIYRYPANNGAGFTGLMVHWQAYYKYGKKYRRGLVLARVAFNTEGSGKLYVISSPDGVFPAYTDIRNGGSPDFAEIRIKDCSGFSNSRELWPASQVPYGDLVFNDTQLRVLETVSIPGYRRTTFWGFRGVPGGANSAQLYYRISMSLPVANTDAPFQWYTRVVPADSTWAINTLLVAEGFMRQYAGVSDTRWGRAAFALLGGGGVWTTYQASNHYAFQNTIPGQIVIGSAMLIAAFLFYTTAEASLWSTLASASANGDRIAIHFMTETGLEASNNLVSTLYGYSNRPLDPVLLFTNTLDGRNTAALWAGPTATTTLIPATAKPAPTNPANLTGTCNMNGLP